MSPRPRKELDARIWTNRVAQRIRDLADARNMTPADLAQALTKRGVKVREKAVGHWFTGHSLPSLRAVEALADIFGYATPGGWLPK